MGAAIQTRIDPLGGRDQEALRLLRMHRKIVDREIAELFVLYHLLPRCTAVATFIKRTLPAATLARLSDRGVEDLGMLRINRQFAHHGGIAMFLHRRESCA